MKESYQKLNQTTILIFHKFEITQCQNSNIGNLPIMYKMFIVLFLPEIQF
jgi:hypothetical protein